MGSGQISEAAGEQVALTKAADFLDIEAFKTAMSCFATGVAVVTAEDDEGPAGFTCQSVVSLSLSPPLVALCPAKSSTSWPRIARAGSFCVNVLSAGQEELCRRFARSGGQKFAGLVWKSDPLGCPVFSGCLATISCTVEITHDAGDHEIVIGRVRAVSFADEGVPLLFFRRKFTSCGPAPRVSD
jgi:flavin reductase (DIM6/NTAB) family NADH-FMN oxidoreductase RutF